MKGFYIRLLLLIVPVSILIIIPFIENSSNSIGGGGYDLTDLFYGAFILIAIFIWIFFIVIHSIVFRKKPDVINENSKLLIIGLVSFITALLILLNTWFE